MEEKSIIHHNQLETSLSDWKLRHNLYQVTRNYRQLQNRIYILELQKKKKLKDIQNKLNSHKKLVQTKIYKHQLKSAIEAWTNNEIHKQNSNSRMFHMIKENRRQNIKKRQDEMRESKHKMFSQIKKLRRQNEKIISLNKQSNLQEKVNKRNRVRLIQIGCKQNIEGFWNSRLESFQEDRKIDLSRKLKEQQMCLRRLQNLQKNEQNLLQQIRRAECIQNDLSLMIDQQKSMDGNQLNYMYVSKVVNNSIN